MARSKVLRYVLFGFQVATLSLVEPRVDRFPVDASSVLIRPGDPVKQVAGGGIVRCTPADTVLLGFAATGQENVLPASIASAPALVDASGRALVTVYLADALTIFTGHTVIAPSQANVLQLHDLQYAIPDASAPTPTVTNQGTPGSTTYSYTVSAATALGETLPGTAGTTTTGNATLNAVNFNQLTLPFVSRAAMFYIYRGGVLIGTAGANGQGTTTFNDTGQAATGGAPSTVNYTGWLVNNTAQATNVLEVRSIDTTPQTPFINSKAVGAVLFAITAAKSQVQNVAGV